MAYLGKRKIAEIAPDHPFATSQISFGVKRPGTSSSEPSKPLETPPPMGSSINQEIESEADGIRAEALRRLKVRQLSKALQDPTKD